MTAAMLQIFAVVYSLYGGTTGSDLKVGDRAPLFSLPCATRDSIHTSELNIADFIGKGTIVLAFYPADWSGGCTKEMCTMRDNFSSLADLGALVFGISGDYVYSHKEWASRLNLQFRLLSDHEHRVARSYGSFNPETGYNRRMIYVIGKDGIIAYIDRAFNAHSPDSFQRLTEFLEGLQ